MNEHLWGNGTPFSEKDKIDNFIKEGLIHLKAKRPVVLVIDGGQSTGKTTLGIHLLDRNNFYCGLPEVNLNEKDNVQYGLGGNQFLNKLPKCQEAGFMSFEYDESGDYSRKGALTGFNRNMDRAMDIVRVFNVMIVIICHDFTKLPKEILDKKIATFLFHCLERDPNHNYVPVKVYDYEGMCWIQHYRKQEVVPEKAYKKVFPNFQFRFKDLSPERSVLLERLSTKNKKDLWEGSDIKIQGLLSFKDIALKVNRSEIWVKKKLSQMNVKEQLLSKKKKYFHPSVLNRLI